MGTDQRRIDPDERCSRHPGGLLRLFLDPHLRQTVRPRRRPKDRRTLPARLPQIERPRIRYGRQRAVPPSVFDAGYEEVSRQVKAKGSPSNQAAINRSLQIGTNQQLGRLEKGLGWLATTASVCPFIGLLGTVLGIIRAFQSLKGAGSASLDSVGPGIAEALIATAAGLFAAIPAAMAYNHFNQQLKAMGSDMDDFGLEFLNLIERSFGD